MHSVDRYSHLAFLVAISERRDVKPFYIDTLPDVEVLYIYGYAEMPLEAWLKGQPNRVAVILEDKIEGVAQFLQNIPLVQEARVHFHYVMQPKEWHPLIAALAMQFPIDDVALVAAPEKRKHTHYARLRRQIGEASFLHKHFHAEEIYKFRLFPNLLANFRRLPQAFLVHELKGKFHNVPALICGAGPSLNTVLPFVRDFKEKGILFAGGSAISAIGTQGISAHFSVAFDPNPEEFDRLKKRADPNSILLYANRVLPKIFTLFQGPIGYVRSHTGGVIEAWFDTATGIGGPSLLEGLAPEALSVTTATVAIATFLGCNPILLAGVDLAFTEGKRYAQGVIEDNAMPVNRMCHRGIETTQTWILEARVLKQFRKQHPKTAFYQITNEGLLPFPYRACGELQFAPWTLPKIETTRVLSVAMPLKTLQESLGHILDTLREFEQTPLIDLKMMTLEDEPAFQAFIATVLPAVEIELQRKGEEEQKWLWIFRMLQQIANNFSN